MGGKLRLKKLKKGQKNAKKRVHTPPPCRAAHATKGSHVHVPVHSFCSSWWLAMLRASDLLLPAAFSAFTWPATVTLTWTVTCGTQNGHGQRLLFCDKGTGSGTGAGLAKQGQRGGSQAGLVWLSSWVWGSARGGRLLGFGRGLTPPLTIGQRPLGWVGGGGGAGGAWGGGGFWEGRLAKAIQIAGPMARWSA